MVDLKFNEFLLFEIVNISDGSTAIVKNYYPANNFVVLHAHSKGDIYSIKPGMTITGQSSGHSKTLTEWNYSTAENNDLFDNYHNDYEYQKYEDKIVVTLDDQIILDDIYNLYPHDILDGPYANLNLEIIDLQRHKGIILDS